MIDWLTAWVPVSEPARGVDLTALAGRLVNYADTGEATWESAQWLVVEGSYAATIAVRGGLGGLWLSGNPIKMLTGQNLDGPECARSLLEASCAVIRRVHPRIPALAGGEARLTRVDVTRSIDLGRRERVRELLRVASIAARSRYQGRAATSHDTIYLARHSRRVSIKLYCKADELQSHPVLGVPDDVGADIALQAEGLLRLEVTLRGMQLRRDGLETIAAWRDPEVARRQWRRYINRVEIPSGVRLLPDEVLALPRALRRTYDLWQRGGDVYELLGKGTRYRQRKAILQASAGRVDIFVLQPAVQTEPLSIHDVGAWLREAPEWRATGRLAEWIQERVA